MILPYDIRRDRRLRQTHGADALSSPEAFIRYSPTCKGEVRQALLSQLEQFNQILLCTNSTDLHGENMRLGKDGRIYAIDLEVINSKEPTLLMMTDYGPSDDLSVAKKRQQALEIVSKKIAKKEVDLLNDSIGNNSFYFKIPIRCVLVGTAYMNQLIVCGDNPIELAQNLTRAIEKSLSERNFEYENLTIIKEQLYKNILSADVPFFTEMGMCLYAGSPGDGVLIARRRSR